ncbi:MAG: transcriptional repressor [Candidatus Manganitrophaceae bacterium]|nr:MAG: transcriptional repressor [Candidatus Manganitrophaceae bacterium]
MNRKKKPLSHPDVEKRLVDAGVQPTAQRIAICGYILGEADHPTAEEIKKWADRHFPKMSRATVYNTVKTLVDAGILQEFKFPHSDAAVYDSNTDIHYHFLDEKTGELHDVQPESVDLSVKLKEGFKVKGIQILLRGTKK